MICIFLTTFNLGIDIGNLQAAVAQRKHVDVEFRLGGVEPSDTPFRMVQLTNKEFPTGGRPIGHSEVASRYIY